MEAVDVSVGLVVRNAGAFLPKVLAHLEQQTYPAGRFEVVVADRSSSDDTPAILEHHAEGSPVKLRTVSADVSTMPAARNCILRESRGRWVVFLDAELLASPKLVETHIRAQDQHGGDCVVVGNIEPHPQAARHARLRHFAPPDVEPFAHNQPLRFLDWRCWNLSAPRAQLVEAGGFDESLAVPGLEDVELAWRLERTEMQGYFNEQAVAYSWQQVNIEREVERRYSEGFTLWHVLGKTHSDVLANRYLGPSGRPWSASELMLAPVYQRVCHSIAVHAGPFDWVCRRMARTAVIQGYRDAKRGRPPRYEAGVTL
ncbi:MAG: glycosyltransferase [Candidatus Hydrogenedentes bacterium]|nr:glycosyltransferase [Candidatus Hydrogenedentota bacterium]